MTSPTDLTSLDPTATYSQIIASTLAQWGLSSLAPLATQLGMSGASNDQISLQIQNSPEYQARFAGNTARAQKGLGVLDPAQYIALEGQYRQILGQLPAGFYDSQDALAGFIGNDVSPSELSDRVSLANSAYVNADQASRDAFDTYYPHAGAGGAVAAILDQSTAEPLLEQQATAAGIGGAAIDQGLALTSQGTAMKAAQQGVTIATARQAYQGIASRLQTDQSVSGRFGGQPFGQQQEESANLLGDGAAANQQALLYSEENAQFSGHGGADATAGNSNNPGSNF